MTSHHDDLSPDVIAAALDRVRRPLTEGEHLPGVFYSSPAVLRREMERVFRRDWLCVGRVEEVARAGDYLATRVAGEPILVTRDDTGDLNAFANLCRHRGVQVVEDGCGNTRRLTCPYHGWAYDLKGCLVGAPMMEEASGFDRRNVGLRELRLDTWAGWIFVNLDDQAMALEEFVAPFERDLGFLQMNRCRLGNKMVSTWNCNWKLVTENLCDPYHFRALHAKTFGPRIPVESYKFEMRERGGSYAFYDAAPQTPDGDAPLGPMPWLSNYSKGMSVFGFLAPNMALVGRIDEFHIYTVWPEAVDRTRVVLHHLFAAEQTERPDFRERARVYTDFMARVVEEDASVAPYLQQAVNSAYYRPGRMSWLEHAVQHQMRYAIERNFG